MIKIVVLMINFLIVGNLFAITNEEMFKLQSEYSDDSNKIINPLIYDENNIKFETKYVKKDRIAESTEDGFVIPAHNTIVGYISIDNLSYKLFDNDYVFTMGQDVIQVTCTNKYDVVLLLMLKHINEGVSFGQIEYKPYIYKVTKDGVNKINEGAFGSGFISFNINETPRYPYYNKKEMLNKLYETGLCERL